MACITDCDAPTVTRDYIQYSSWELRYRTGFSGLYGVHPANRRSEEFNAAFHQALGNAMYYIYYYGYSARHGQLDWIGEVGAQVCKSGCHSSGNALDITALRFNNTTFDMNVGWRNGQPFVQRRGYLAIWAGLRMYCRTVLTNAYNQAHEDHIHVDNDGRGSAAPPAIRTAASTDTKLIQTTCNLLNGASLAIDGSWGSATTREYDDLLDQLGMACLSPTTNFWHARTLLILIMRHGFASASAGTYRYHYCS